MEGGLGMEGSAHACRHPHFTHPGASRELAGMQAEAVRGRAGMHAGALTPPPPAPRLTGGLGAIITGEEQKLLPGWCIPTSPVSPLLKGSYIHVLEEQ